MTGHSNRAAHELALKLERMAQGKQKPGAWAKVAFDAAAAIADLVVQVDELEVEVDNMEVEIGQLRDCLDGAIYIPSRRRSDAK